MKLVLIVSLAIFALGSCRSPPFVKPKCGCPFIDEPVCGTMPDGTRRNFESRCRAGCEQAVDITPGKCDKDSTEERPPGRDCGCKPVDDPVCAQYRNGKFADFRNKCEAGCRDAVVVKQGKCGVEPNPVCECPPVDEPVCGEDLDGTLVDYPNSCEAGCALASIVRPGKCSDPPIRVCGCPPIRDPVCAINSEGVRADFPNRCVAGCADATDIQQGACDNKPPRCMCPLLLSPVCGTLPNGTRVDFPNTCEAKCEDATDIQSGECGQQPPTCPCPLIYLPVCAKLPDGTRQDFANQCVAKCHHATDLQQGECDHKPPTCICPKLLAPVCGKLSDGTRQDFPNQCLARCANATHILPGECCKEEEPPHPLCGCQPIDDPVCAIRPSGALDDFPNRCEASCAGATDIQDGKCEEEPEPPKCFCPALLSPVCGSLAHGRRKDFPNSCLAKCHKATDVTPGKCDGSSGIPPIPLCGCEPIDEPVCAKRPDGSLADFPNPCEAGCANGTDVTPGKCGGSTDIPPIPLCGCEPIDEPVCAKRPDGSLADFPNPCEAGCAKATDATPGKCGGSTDIPPIPLCGCKPIDEPVCAKRPDGSLADFPNPCEAGCANASDLKPGKCNSREPNPPGCLCPFMLMPVCGKLADGNLTDFANPCLARCVHATDIKPGKCDGSSGFPNMRLCGCPPIVDPVCGKRTDGTLADFPNKCEAGCADATDIKRGKCADQGEEHKECICPEIYSPVCGKKPDGTQVDFENDCIAKCEDATNLRPGYCYENPVICICPKILAPVCGKLPDGTQHDFVNDCLATCHNATDVKRGKCDGSPDIPPIRLCGCPPIEDPVCGKLADGTFADFPNTCEAGCALATDVTPGKCGSRDTEERPPIRLCGCPPIDDPVCAMLKDKSRVVFQNRCKAGCADAKVIGKGACKQDGKHIFKIDRSQERGESGEKMGSGEKKENKHESGGKSLEDNRKGGKHIFKIDRKHE